MTEAAGTAGLSATLSKPAITPRELHALGLLPISLNSIYEACKSGEIECFRIGHKVVIPTAPLRRKFGLDG